MIRIARVVLIKGKGKNKRVLAVANMEFPPEDRWFGFPGGTVRVGESVKKGARREMQEEAGYKVGGLVLVSYTEKRKEPNKHIGHYYYRATRHHGRMKNGPTRGKDGRIEDGPPQWVFIQDIQAKKVLFHPDHIKILQHIGEL